MSNNCHKRFCEWINILVDTDIFLTHKNNFKKIVQIDYFYIIYVSLINNLQKLLNIDWNILNKNYTKKKKKQ